MKTRVYLDDRSYTVAIADSYHLLPAQLEPLNIPKYGWVISHKGLFARYGPRLLTPLHRAGWSLEEISVPQSESSKSFDVAKRLIERISRKATKGMPVLFAFGGGVIGDLVGFVAAVLNRGVPYIQIPTTLLGQVDSAIGGKVGVDLPHAKNLVGSFYQPRLVYNNLSVLNSLPLRQLKAGLAEVIKYAAIADTTMFSFLEEHMEACLSMQTRALRVLVERSCRIKARIVSRDEREIIGERTCLNFGHTLGHALEAATQYRRFTHGEAIAIGMCAAAGLSLELGVCKEPDANRLIRLIRLAGLPTKAHGVAIASIFNSLRFDKKFIHGRQRWVLLKQIGSVTVKEDIPPLLIRRAILRYIG